MFFRKLPEHEVAGIPQAEVARAVQAFADVAALADLAPGFVFLLLRRPDFAEVQLDVGRELKRGTVERAGLLLGQPCLELLNRSVSKDCYCE